MREYVAVDLETTGLSPIKERIIEIGAIRFVDGRETERFQTFVDPECPLPDRIVALTGIHDEMLIGAPKEPDAIQAFLSFAKDAVLLGHNLPFDYSFLKTAYVRLVGGAGDTAWDRMGIDTLAIAKKYLGGLESRTLSALCVHYGIDTGTSHRATDDARSAACLYERMRNEFGEANPEHLIYAVPKREPITPAQKNYLNDLIKYHRIDCNVSFEALSKSEASRMIDRIILRYGKIVGRTPGKRVGSRQND